MARPRTPIGTFGEVYVENAPGGRARAFARFGDHDGQLRRVQATGPTPNAAERQLKQLLAERTELGVGQGELTANSSFRQLVDLWLADLDLEDKIAPSTRALDERNMEQLVLPPFEHDALREISVRTVDQFIKTLAGTKSYSMARCSGSSGRDSGSRHVQWLSRLSPGRTMQLRQMRHVVAVAEDGPSTSIGTASDPTCVMVNSR